MYLCVGYLKKVIHRGSLDKSSLGIKFKVIMEKYF
jgi:hypothetical protein